MSRREKPGRCGPAVHCCAAACMLLLASCAVVPALTLSGTSSWRQRHDDGARTHAWSAGALLGWSAGGADPTRAAGHAAQAEEPGAGRATRIDDAGPPCAFDATCAWEHAARSAALERAGDTFEGDGP